MKKMPLLVAGFMFATTLLQAVSVDLKTGYWPIDCSRAVEIDNFDYVYEIKNTCLGGRFIELLDGSVWQLEPLGPESRSYYQNYRDRLEIGFIEEWVDLWQPGEQLIFHKITDRKINNHDVLLVYNINRGQLFDVTPLSSPIYCSLTVSEIDKTNKLILLSDGSVWKYECWDKANTWNGGDSILIAKDTPWISSHTHVLVNLEYSQDNTTLGNIYRNRVSVNRLQ